jgi:drug/metabolite transporter (DMT)-like permease
MKKLYGVLLVVVSAAAFGAMAVLAPVAYHAGTNPITLLFLRFTIAGLAMTILMIVRKKEFPRGRLLLSLVLMGGVWYVAQSWAYFTALTMASAGLVALLLYLYPALVALISAIVFREQMARPKLASLGLALAGTVLTIGPNGEGESLGILLALTAALLYATYIVVGGELMERVEALAATTVIMLAAGMSYGAIVAVHGFQAPRETGGWMAIIATAGCSIIAIGTFLSTVEPFVTVGLAALLLRERIEAIQLAGGVCILIAVVFLARGELVVNQQQEI